MKIRKIEHIRDGKKYHHDQYEYMCKGCGYTHVFSLSSEGGHHHFNMDFDNPTVMPSLLQNFGGESKLCHSFIKDGMIQYLSDCEHDLAGKTIELPILNSSGECLHDWETVDAGARCCKNCGLESFN